jgi:hypothetical protein
VVLLRCLLVGAVAVAGCGGSAAAAASSEPRFSWPVEIGNLSDRLAGVGLVAADLNGDGNADLAAASVYVPAVAVLFGTGNGSFRRPVGFRTARDPAALAVADVDADGDPDLVAASFDRTGSVSVLLNRGRGRFRRAGTHASAARAAAIAAGDVDSDGLVDLVTTHESRTRLTVLLGEGGGRFRAGRRYAAAPPSVENRCRRALALGDLDGDGTLDVALTKPASDAVAIRLGRGDGSFGPPRTIDSGDQPCDVELHDLDHDGRLDLSVAAFGDSSFSVFRGNGDGTVRPRRSYVMHVLEGFGVDALAIGDLDRDGHLDIATPTFGGTVPVRRGRGDGTFAGVRHVPVRAGSTSGGTVADFNGDGWLDLAFERGDFGDAWAYVLLSWTGEIAPPCVVPNLGYGGWPRDLRRTGCRRGRISRRYSRTVPRGTVISQRPAPGEVRPSRSEVDVVLSRGRARGQE